MHLSTSEAESEDEDVAHEHTRVSSGDVGDDVLVLRDLTKVSLSFFLYYCYCFRCLVSFMSHIHIGCQLAKLVVMDAVLSRSYKVSFM